MEVLFEDPISVEAFSLINLITPNGVYGAILGKIHEDSSNFRHLFPSRECLLSPVIEFCLVSVFELVKESWFSITVPLENLEYIKGDLKVRHISKDFKTITNAKLLEEGQEPSRTVDTVYYRFAPHGLEIFTHRFSQFIITSESCCRFCELLAFASPEVDENNQITAKLYLCSFYNEKTDYKEVSIVLFKVFGHW